MNERRGVRRAGGAACVIAALVLAAWTAPSVRAVDEFEIAGEVDGLYPGANATLDAQVTNPHPFPIRVISTAVTVHDASPACLASLLEIGDSQATVDVPPGAAATVPLEIHMDLGAPDACQGATWPLEFTGTAVGTATTGLPGTSLIDPRSLEPLVAIGALLTVAGLVALARDRRRRQRRAT